MGAAGAVSVPPPQKSIRPLWSQSLGTRLRGLALAREKGLILTWDEQHWLTLLDLMGRRQGQAQSSGALVTACCADDGSAIATAGSKGEVCWLAPDLALRWKRSMPNRPVAVALDPFGQYLAVADQRSGLQLFDRHGRQLVELRSPRPLHHLAFVPAEPYLFGSADYGLVACFDFAGQCVWRDGLVAHIGSLATSGAGEEVLLACFTEGLQRYTLTGKNQGRWSVGEACRLAAVAFDGRTTLMAGLSNRLLLLDHAGQVQASTLLDEPPVALALAALADSAVVALAGGVVVHLELGGASGNA